LFQGIDLGAQTGEAVQASELSQHGARHQVRHGPVVLPETDQPEQPSVGVPVEARSRSVRSRDREANFTDLTDSRVGGFGKR